MLKKKANFEDAVLSVVPKMMGTLFRKRLTVKINVKKTLLPVFYASFRQGYSVNQAVEDLRKKGYDVHSAKYILDKLKQLDADYLVRIFDICREMIFQALLKLNSKKRKCLIAIDYHDKPFYGDKKTKGTVGCKRKASTNYAYRYITACIVEEGKRFNLASMPVTQLDDEQELLKEVIRFCKKYAEIGCLLLDKGFNSVENYRLLEEELKENYIMPQQKNEKLVAILKSEKFTAQSQFEYTFYETRSEEYRYKVKMFYIIAENGEKYAFVTNINATDKGLLDIIVQCYDKRWGIETGYRIENKFLCKTTSKSFTIRTFFSLLSFLLQDFWIFNNYLLHKEKGIHEPRSKKILESKTLAEFLKVASEKLKFIWKPINKVLVFCEQCCSAITYRLKKATSFH